MSCAALVVGMLVVGGIFLTLGGVAANAAIVAVLFLMPAITNLGFGQVVLSGLWAMAVAVTGLIVGPDSVEVLLLAVVVTALIQGFFATESGNAGVNRGPAALVAFAAFVRPDADGRHIELWRPILGSALGVVITLCIAIAVFGVQKKRIHLAPLSERLFYGLGLASGCLILAGLWEAFGWTTLVPPLVVFCIIYTFDPQRVARTALYRTAGAFAGVAVAWLLATLLPVPVLVAVYFAFFLLSTAMMLMGHQIMYVTFVVSSVVLATAVAGGDYIAVGRIQLLAVVMATAVALLLHIVSVSLHDQYRRFLARKEIVDAEGDRRGRGDGPRIGPGPGRTGSVAGSGRTRHPRFSRITFRSRSALTGTSVLRESTEMTRV